ncbi:MAG: heparin lyase I family protein [Rhizomicrobium sp.]
MTAISIVATLVVLSTAADGDTPNGVTVAVNGQTFLAQNASKDWSLVARGTPLCLYRFELRAGDVWPHDVDIGHGGYERSELSGPGDAGDVGAFDADVWTAYQFRIAPGARSTPDWVVLGDWHMQPDAGDAGVSSPWQLELLPGDILAFDTRTSTEKPIRTNPHIHDIWKSSAPIARGRWHALVSRVVFDWHPDGKGEIDVWLDGKPIVDYRGPVGFNTARPPYFKFGIYRAPAPETLAVAYANVEISRSSLVRRVAHPPQVCRR